MMPSPGSLSLRTPDLPREVRSSPLVSRTRTYSFVLDDQGEPIEIGSGRFAKAYLGEERWLESKTDFRREVVIKVLQKGVSEDDHLRFQMEKELLERVQGHANIVRLYASGEAEDPSFFPSSIRDKVEPDFVVLERMEMSLEAIAPRAQGRRGDRPGRPVLFLQALPRRERRAHRPARHADRGALHDPQQAGQLLPGARRRDRGYP
jgi:hypothetical protein